MRSAVTSPASDVFASFTNHSTCFPRILETSLLRERLRACVVLAFTRMETDRDGRLSRQVQRSNSRLVNSNLVKCTLCTVVICP